MGNEKKLTVDEDWSILPGPACSWCGSSLRVHPQTSHIWGCLKCGYTIASGESGGLAKFFVSKQIIDGYCWG